MTFARDPKRYRTVEGVEERRCTQCELWFAHTVDNFHRRGNGLQSCCKACGNALSRAAEARRWRPFRGSRKAA